MWLEAHEVEQSQVVAPQVGGRLNGFACGANGTEWRQWMQPAISEGKVTSMPTSNARLGGFSADSKTGFLCEAHRQGIRVLDADTIEGIYSGFSLSGNSKAMILQPGIPIY